jgi:hypothetical protein
MSQTNIKKISIIGMLAALLVAVIFSAVPAKAADDTFDIYVKHNINGRSLGLEKELPVDVYVNGNYAFTFEFKQDFSAPLPAGEYTFEVKLAGTDTTVMSFGPAEIPAGVDVNVKAKLSADKTPVLKVKVK